MKIRENHIWLKKSCLSPLVGKSHELSAINHTGWPIGDSQKLITTGLVFTYPKGVGFLAAISDPFSDERVLAAENEFPCRFMAATFADSMAKECSKKSRAIQLFDFPPSYKEASKPLFHKVKKLDIFSLLRRKTTFAKNIQQQRESSEFDISR